MQTLLFAGMNRLTHAADAEAAVKSGIGVTVQSAAAEGATKTITGVAMIARVERVQASTENAERGQSSGMRCKQQHTLIGCCKCHI
jgi:hypothetical protein